MAREVIGIISYGQQTVMETDRKNILPAKCKHIHDISERIQSI